MAGIKVLMFCPQFRPVIGGAERQAEKLAIALAALGCQVCILTPRIDSESPNVEEVLGIRIERFTLRDLSKRWHFPGIALFNIPFILFQIIRVIRLHLRQADLLHAHLASLQTLGAIIAARLSGKPALCKTATADYGSDLGEIEKQGISGKIVAWLTRRYTPCWVATTRAVQEALIRANVKPDRIVQIPNGIALPKEIYIRRHNVRRFLYLGRLSTNTHRDLPTLIAAFDNIAVQIPDAELAMVGGGDLLEEIRREVELCVHRQRIYVPGFDVPDRWIEWADCFVLPSRREGLSNALLEAMAARLPCIANDIPPNREVLADGAAGLLVSVCDIDALTMAMWRIASDSAYAQAMGTAAHLQAAQHYGIDSVADRYIELYKLLLNK